MPTSAVEVSEEEETASLSVGDCARLADIANKLQLAIEDDGLHDDFAEAVRFLRKLANQKPGSDPFEGMRPASVSHIKLSAAVLRCLETGIEPDTVRRFVDEELTEAAPQAIREGDTPEGLRRDAKRLRVMDDAGSAEVLEARADELEREGGSNA